MGKILSLLSAVRILEYSILSLDFCFRAFCSEQRAYVGVSVMSRCMASYSSSCVSDSVALMLFSNRSIFAPPW